MPGLPASRLAAAALALLAACAALPEPGVEGAAPPADAAALAPESAAATPAEDAASGDAPADAAGDPSEAEPAAAWTGGDVAMACDGGEALIVAVIENGAPRLEVDDAPAPLSRAALTPAGFAATLPRGPDRPALAVAADFAADPPRLALADLRRGAAPAPARDLPCLRVGAGDLRIAVDGAAAVLPGPGWLPQDRETADDELLTYLRTAGGPGGRRPLYMATLHSVPLLDGEAERGLPDLTAALTAALHGGREGVAAAPLWIAPFLEPLGREGYALADWRFEDDPAPDACVTLALDFARGEAARVADRRRLCLDGTIRLVLGASISRLDADPEGGARDGLWPGLADRFTASLEPAG